MEIAGGFFLKISSFFFFKNVYVVEKEREKSSQHFYSRMIGKKDESLLSSVFFIQTERSINNQNHVGNRVNRFSSCTITKNWSFFFRFTVLNQMN